MMFHGNEPAPPATARYFAFQSPEGWPSRPLFPAPGEYEAFLDELAARIRRRPWLAEYPDLASLVEATTEGLAGAVETDGGTSARATGREVLELSPGAKLIVRYEWVVFWPDVPLPRRT